MFRFPWKPRYALSTYHVASASSSLSMFAQVSIIVPPHPQGPRLHSWLSVVHLQYVPDQKHDTMASALFLGMAIGPPPCSIPL